MNSRRLAIVAIACTLAAIASCALIFNPGKYGITPIEMDRVLRDGR